MKTKITEAKEKLDEQLVSSPISMEGDGSMVFLTGLLYQASGEEHSPEEITKAKEAAAAAMTAMRETS